MLYIEGSIKLIPLSVGAEGGTLQQEGGLNAPVVMISLETEVGYVDVAIPPENIDQLTEALQKAKDEANAAPTTDIIVSQDISDAEKLSDANDQLKG